MIRVPSLEPLGVAYRDWLLDLAGIETDSGCPRLLGMRSDGAMYFADMTKDWSSERRRNLLRARVKWLFNKNYGYARSEPTEEERAADASWDYPFVGRDFGLGAFRTPGRSETEITRASGKTKVVDADKAQAVLRLDRLERGDFKIDKRLLRQTIKSAMQSSFGLPEVVGSGWQYRTTISEFMVSTMLDFGGRYPSQLRYHQRIHFTRNEKSSWLLNHGGVGALLGWPQSEWFYLTDGDMPAAAELLARLCKEFVDAVPGLWERSGLGIETTSA